jgi:RNA polymerase sigma factor (sigma-70 family)
VQSSEAYLRRLMTDSLDGDAQAHNALLKALVPLLRAFFGRRMDNSAEVEDLVQDTLIAVHTRRASYDQARPFAPWLFAVARYKLIDAFRRRRDHLSIDGLDDLFGDDSFESATSAQLDVAALLDTLPAKQASAIRNTRIEGLSTAEAAARDGISESDVKVSVHRGLKALMARLGRSE